MNSFKSYVYKEFIEGVRSYRFLILSLGIFFFAIFDPVMLKLVPVIMKSQIPADLSGLFNFTAAAAVESFLGEIFEITSLVVALTLMGILAREREHRSLVIPYCTGARFPGLILAKIAVYSSLMVLVLIPSVFISRVYSAILFGGEQPPVNLLFKAALNLSIYLVYLVALTTCVSAFFKKGLPAAFVTLAVVYLMPAAAGLFKIKRWVPSFLATGSSSFLTLGTESFLPALLITAAVIVLLYGSSVLVMRGKEL